MNHVVLPIQVDRNSPVPLYFQVAQHLEHMIESGELATGTRLENEIGLADRLGLSRPTMRRAIEYLVDRGLLVRKRGVGTQVLHPKVQRQIELTSLYDDLAKTRRNPHTRVLSSNLLRLTAEDLEVQGLYNLLRANGINLRIAKQSIGARAATAAEARALGETKAAPLLTMVRAAYDDQGRAVEHGDHIYRASRYSFDLTLTGW